MLGFFRRFQKGIFIVITAVIVISFSFFGTSNVSEKPVKDEVAFTAIDGTKVHRSEVEALTQFLSSDSTDQLNWGAPLGANFLNDGVIRNDFLKGGLAAVLFDTFYPELQNEWGTKWKKEKTFQGYKHPEVPYFSSDAVWTHFAPQLKEALKNYKASDLENPQDQFEKKVSLYLAEGEFSEQKLRQTLYFQLQQAKWIQPDKNLQYQNLALFGYRNLNDWFGHDFLKLSATFILNAAKVAEKQGYKVSLDEATHDLKKKALTAFEIQKQNPMMTFTEPSQYLREQLRYLGMDLGQAAQMWQKVLLFRKMFNDLGSSVVVDKETLAPFVDYVAKQVEVATYRLPKDVQVKDFRQFQRFETYLQAVSKDSNDLLETTWKQPGDETVAPELLMKRYLVDLKEVDVNDLSQNLSLKTIWQWQVSDLGWEKLTQSFPALAANDATDETSRFSALDQLDDSTKEKVDRESKILISKEHPEWVEEALAKVPTDRKTLIFYKRAQKNPLKGLTKPEKAIAMLDAEALEEQPTITLKEMGEKTWQVKLYDRSPDWEVATFAEAEKEGNLEEMTVALLKTKQEELKVTSSNFDKPFNDVRDAVAQEYFRKEINRARKALVSNESSQSIDVVSSYRMQPYLASLVEKEEESYVQATLPQEQDKLSARISLADQFKLIKEETVWDRSQNGTIGREFANLVGENKVSDVIRKPNGELFFYRTLGSKNQAKEDLMNALVLNAKNELANSLQAQFAKKLVVEFKEKEAMKLASSQ